MTADRLEVEFEDHTYTLLHKDAFKDEDDWNEALDSLQVLLMDVMNGHPKWARARLIKEDVL